jgi:hypothetical protein
MPAPNLDEVAQARIEAGLSSLGLQAHRLEASTAIPNLPEHIPESAEQRSETFRTILSSSTG